MTTLASPGPAVAAAPPARKKYVPVVGPRLKKLLAVVFGLFALLCVNSLYLVAITIAEWWTGSPYQNLFYQWMFAIHLAFGLAIVLPVVIFGIIHMRNAAGRPNRRAARAGYALFAVALITLISGFLLTRVDIFGLTPEIRNPFWRDVAYWTHIVAPLGAIWLFVLHRLAGRRIKWKVGAIWGGVALGAAALGVAAHSHDPRDRNVRGPKDGEAYFFPSLARTATGNFIPAEAMMMNEYCLRCHPDVHASWAGSAHAFSSFNNPPYAFSVRETRREAFEREGSVADARWCAGCHDPVPFLSGAFEDPRFDDPAYDVSTDPLGAASISCIVCHSVTHVDGTIGNAAYTLEEPIHYPFAFSENRFLQWINEQLVKANPSFHKQTFLKPLHGTAEFCAACHKVHLPPELNDYKWLRGQNSFDSFHLSGVSGHGIQSWYYPPKAETDCNGCHMPLIASNDFGAKSYDDSGQLKVKSHLFPSANTAIPHLVGHPDAEAIIAAHKAFNEGVIRVDIFGIREDGAIDGALHAPLRPELPALRPGGEYLVEVVVRTVKMGHELTQGTADSNELWLDVVVTSGDRVIGRSGGLDEDGDLDPWSRKFNVYMLDREGNRIDRRNPQDIFVPLYNHQIPPGAGDVTHLGLRIPEDVVEPVRIDVAVRYRKFDTTYMRYVYGESYRNDLPIMTMATDSVVLPVAGGSAAPSEQTSPIDPWQRWNDYGIGLFRLGSAGSSKGQLRQSEEAFRMVEALGRPDGPLNQARVQIREGRLDDAVVSLGRAAAHDPPASPWSTTYFTAIVNRENGFLDAAIADYKTVVASQFPGAAERGFDFSTDYRLLTELGQTIFERARQERGEERRTAREDLLRESAAWLRRALSLDTEYQPAHYALSQVFDLLGDREQAEHHRLLHEKYRVDDNARDVAVAAARRRDPAANHAAEAVVIYDLQRSGAFGLPPEAQSSSVPDRSTTSSAQ
ncbi:MAG TPA: multiheme c-type cytochrome [Phycisphaerales bacterium]|nr:multiheme c-type cytochrome [Phycisphaerales bacterium]HMP36973.1 multiheme c-type cytochrome [Phycisphaerales bacterium]